MTTSVLDFIFRDLALSYLQRTDLVQVKPNDLRSTATVDEESSDSDVEQSAPTPEMARVTETAQRHSLQNEIAATARVQGYEGDPCPECGHFTLVRNGTCLKCETCGSTTGCS